jgi:hypothetical protein
MISASTDATPAVSHRYLSVDPSLHTPAMLRELKVVTYRITIEPGITITVPRTTSRDIQRYKASN